MIISMNEILMGQVKLETLDQQTQSNLKILHERINIIRIAYGKPMVISSGLRTVSHHLAIYKAKGITDPKNIPMQSKHLIGAACDVHDPNRELQKWTKENIALLESIGLWCEAFESTPTWVHFQIYRPKSGRRFFLP